MSACCTGDSDVSADGVRAPDGTSDGCAGHGDSGSNGHCNSAPDGEANSDTSAFTHCGGRT
jgi:hypothetical protein